MGRDPSRIGLYRGNGDADNALRFKMHYNALRMAFGTGLPFDDAVAAAFQTVVELTHRAGRTPRAASSTA